MATENGYIVQTFDLTKDLQMGQVTIQALRGVTLNVQRGEVLSIIGPSGSGKSTLLGLVGGLDSPTAGRILLDGQDITALGERELTRIRNEKIGFVFQFFNLIPTLTAEENVALPILVARHRPDHPSRRARDLLTLLEVGDRLHHRPSQLSGGQQQRVAIARALANNPPLLMCDEPTGNLDTVSGALVMQALHDVNEEMGTTIIIVTHDMDVASQAHRVIALVDGQIADEYDPRSSAQRAGLEILRQGRHLDSGSTSS
ncbi:MAG TPA: ABC transporter ATP-binding protein [Aggregatilinea sp.]|uniref:ABC transporter ATP-binding protein n=1 Tax=Aggregatilinea sp. TaxID=2806333 RepID=UPI002D1C6E50|nr:ABC transporter ATP-binding protein [Aggregatilinea sp.]HML20901.1 ABC transporter ATP-binding protein [Aggregatilinea sp.]